MIFHDPLLNNGKYTPFHRASWKEIARVCADGKAQEAYNLRDYKNVELSGIGTMTLEIADFSHDYLSASTSADKASISLITRDLLYDTYKMNPTDTNVGGFPDSSLYDILSTTIWNALPSDLRSVVKTIYKWYGTGNATTNGEWFGSKIWMPLGYEMFGDTPNSSGPETEHTTGNARKYPIYTDDESRIKYMNNGEEIYKMYWLASPSKYNAVSFQCVTFDGDSDSMMANRSNIGVCFGISI